MTLLKKVKKPGFSHIDTLYVGTFNRANTVYSIPVSKIPVFFSGLNISLKYTDPSGHAHYNPGDPSYTTHPKVCYSYSYPQVETQPTPVSNPYAELQPKVDTGNEFINFLV